jgi:hypothetical protein
MPRRKVRKELTESEWADVFRLRCRSKRGEFLSTEEGRRCRLAWESDPERYESLNKAVFDATKPFGAS